MSKTSYNGPAGLVKATPIKKGAAFAGTYSISKTGTGIAIGTLDGPRGAFSGNPIEVSPAVLRDLADLIEAIKKTFE
jgi:hypothetical protein